MSASPQQPQDKTQNQETNMAEPVQQLWQYLLSMRTPAQAEPPSLGEMLLPFLFAAMETCWLDAIFIGLASLGLFQSHEPLMPLWAPFVFLIGTQWLLNFQYRRTTNASSTPS